MDAPWRRLGERLSVRTGQPVTRVEARDGGVLVTVRDAEPIPYDGAVVAVPAPVATAIVAGADLPDAVRRIEYAPHVRLYAARRAAGPPRVGVHVFPNDDVATIEFGRGSDGSWGRAPADVEWALVCAPSATSGPLLELDDEAVKERLWSVATGIEPRLFPLESAETVHLIRWPHAVPKVDRGYLARVATIPRRPPIAFAGDWLVQPCVEGAVRSGERAAAVFGSVR